MPRELVLLGPRNLDLREYEDGPLAANEVRAQAVLSGISIGTEMNQYRATAPLHHKRFDHKRSIFVPDSDWRPYPKGLGYEWAGRVVEIGAEVEGFQIGDLVHLPSHHRETNTFAGGGRTIYGAIKPLPADLPTEKAVMISLAGVALQGIHDAHIKLGDRVAVFGLGVLGLFTVQLARLNGASWIDAVDPICERRALAEAFGADHVLDPESCDVGFEIKSAGSRKGADVAIEMSGNNAALHEAIRCVRVAGLVVAGGYYQGDATGLRLGEEWHHNRVTMVSTMGSHHCPHRDYPLWDRERVQDEAIRLLREDKLQTEGLVTHRESFERAQDAYQLIDRTPQAALKVVLTY